RRLLVLDRRRPREIQGERGFATTRPPGHRHHLPGVQAVGDLVELLEAGGDAGTDTAGGRDPLDLVEGALEQRVDVDVVLGGAPPMRLSWPTRVSSADTVTASAGSPRV